MIRNVKISSKFQETEDFITEILETIEDIGKNRTDHLSSVQQQRQNVEKDILAVRIKINKQLDEIQDSLINELDIFETKAQKQTTEFLTSLELNEKELNDYHTTMSTIKQFTTDLQTFISIHEIERGVAVIDKSIHSLLKTDTMNDTALSCNLNNIVQQFSTKISIPGKIIVNSKPCQLNISRRKYKQAQTMVPFILSNSIENITTQLKQTINTQANDTTGCLLLPDGRMLFSCYSECSVKSINKDGTQDFDTGKLSPGTFDITYIEDNNTIAVTSGGNNPPCFRVIDLGSGDIKKNIKVKSFCHGIVYRDNTLIYCARSKGRRMINLNDDSESDVYVRQTSPMAYVAPYKDKLYYTNRETHTVTCCDLHGNTQWQFKDESVLKKPLAVTVDNYGNVFVVSSSTHKVVVISSNGRLGRQLLGKEDGLKFPQVLHYDITTNQLLVANLRNAAFLFQVARPQ